MTDEVYMDIPVVEKMADSFGNFAEILQAVSKAMEAAMMILRATAFVGLVGGAVVERWIGMMKPNVDKMAAKMDELSRDVDSAVRSYRDGDNTGSSRFR